MRRTIAGARLQQSAKDRKPRLRRIRNVHDHDVARGRLAAQDLERVCRCAMSGQHELAGAETICECRRVHCVVVHEHDGGPGVNDFLRKLRQWHIPYLESDGSLDTIGTVCRSLTAGSGRARKNGLGRLAGSCGFVVSRMCKGIGTVSLDSGGALGVSHFVSLWLTPPA